MKKHTEILVKHLILNNLMPDTVLMRKKFQECSKWTNIIYLFPVATEQWWWGCAQHRTWLCWLLPGKLIYECTAHGHVLKGKSELSNSAFCYKQYSHIHAPDTTSLFHCKNDVWLQSLALKRREVNSFQFNFPPACRVHSSSSDFVICSVEIYLRVGDPRLPLGTMKGYRHF